MSMRVTDATVVIVGVGTADAALAGVSLTDTGILLVLVVGAPVISQPAPLLVVALTTDEDFLPTATATAVAVAVAGMSLGVNERTIDFNTSVEIRPENAELLPALLAE